MFLSELFLLILHFNDRFNPTACFNLNCNFTFNLNYHHFTPLIPTLPYFLLSPSYLPLHILEFQSNPLQLCSMLIIVSAEPSSIIILRFAHPQTLVALSQWQFTINHSVCNSCASVNRTSTKPRTAPPEGTYPCILALSAIHFLYLHYRHPKHFPSNDQPWYCSISC